MRRLFVPLAAVAVLVVCAVPARADFLNNASAIPAPNKVDKIPCEAGHEAECLTSAEFNSIVQALLDIRSAIVTGGVSAVDSYARTLALGKNKVYFQASAPTGDSLAAGDVWFDTAHSNRPYVYDGAQWVDAHDATAVITAEIADGAVTTGKIGTSAVTTAKLADGSVSAVKLVDGAVGTAKIADLSILATKLADNAVTTAKLADGSITTGKIAGSAVDATKLADGSVSAAKLVGGSVDYSKLAQDVKDAMGTGGITPGSITETLIASDAVTTPKLAANAVTTAKIAAYSVTADQIGAVAVTAGKIAAGAVGANELAANSVVAGKIAAGTIGANEIAANAVTAGKIATNAITSDKIYAGSIDATKIATGAVTTDKLLAGAVGANELAANSVVAGKIATNAVTADAIVSGAVIAGKLAAGAVTAGKIDTGAVTATTIASGAVTAGKVAAGAITADNIAASAITADKLTVGQLEQNMWPNGTSEVAPPTGADTSTAEWAHRSSSAAYGGAWGRRISAPSGEVDSTQLAFKCGEGDSFSLRAYVRVTTNYGGGQITPVIKFFNGSGSELSVTSSFTSSASWVQKTIQATAPAGTAYGIMYFAVVNAIADFDNIVARRQVDGDGFSKRAVQTMTGLHVGPTGTSTAWGTFSNSFTWPVAFPDDQYAMIVTFTQKTGYGNSYIQLGAVTKTASGFTLSTSGPLNNGASGTYSGGTVDVTAIRLTP